MQGSGVRDQGSERLYSQTEVSILFKSISPRTLLLWCRGMKVSKEIKDGRGIQRFYSKEDVNNLAKLISKKLKAREILRTN